MRGESLDDGACLRIVVQPETPDVQPKLAAALSPRIGYLGSLLPGKPAVALTVSADGSTLVSIGSGLPEAIDLRTRSKLGRARPSGIVAMRLVSEPGVVGVDPVE